MLRVLRPDYEFNSQLTKLRHNQQKNMCQIMTNYLINKIWNMNTSYQSTCTCNINNKKYLWSLKTLKYMYLKVKLPSQERGLSVWYKNWMHNSFILLWVKFHSSCEFMTSCTINFTISSIVEISCYSRTTLGNFSRCQESQYFALKTWKSEGICIYRNFLNKRALWIVITVEHDGD